MSKDCRESSFEDLWRALRQDSKTKKLHHSTFLVRDSMFTSSCETRLEVAGDGCRLLTFFFLVRGVRDPD